MKKGLFYYFTVAFLGAFGFSMIYFKNGQQIRFPASADLTADQKAALATSTMDRINSVYTQTLMQEATFAQGSAVYDTALQQSVTNRQQYVAQNPNQFMWPGNQFDNQYSHLSSAKMAIARDRQHNLTYNALQILLIKKQNLAVLSPAQQAEIDQKYLNLVNLMTASTTDGLYSYPAPNDPFLLNLSPGSVLGTQTPLVQQPELQAQVLPQPEAPMEVLPTLDESSTATIAR